MGYVRKLRNCINVKDNWLNLRQGGGCSEVYAAKDKEPTRVES